MPKRRDFLFAQRSPDRDRTMADRVQHKTTALRALLLSAGTGDHQARRKLDFDSAECHINTLTPAGTKSRFGHCSGRPSGLHRSCGWRLKTEIPVVDMGIRPTDTMKIRQNSGESRLSISRYRALAIATPLLQSDRRGPTRHRFISYSGSTVPPIKKKQRLISFSY